MKEIIVLVILVVVTIIIIRLIIKLTSFFIKLLLWLILISIGLYIFNYYVLSKLGLQPLPLKEKVVNIVKNKKLKEKIKSEVEKTVQKTKPQVEQIVKDKIIKDTLQKLTTGSFTK